MEIILPNKFTPRPYQKALMSYLDNGGLRAVAIWHRRCGKDNTMLHQLVKMAHQRIGTYWHLLPTQVQARKVLYDAFSSSGIRLIDHAIPPEIRAKPPNSTLMKFELKCGSIIQFVGSDAYDSLVGSNPIGVVFSEWSLTNPKAWDLVRPILRENGGFAVFIYTPRGYNHGWDVKQIAESSQDWFYSFQTVKDTGLLTEEDIEAERRSGMPEELVQQEYYCSFTSANLGAILGHRIEEAETDGRINDNVERDPDGAPIDISLDLGFRDTTAVWWWQRRPDGFGLLDHMEDSGLDAQDWCDRIANAPYPIGTIWLPHDAKARTFATKHSALEQFLRAFKGKVKILPVMRIADRVNAARTVLPLCHFNKTRTREGIAALRAWSYAFDESRKVFSKDPQHDWASHSSDGFSYGAVVMAKTVPQKRVRSASEIFADDMQQQQGAHMVFTLEQMFEDYAKQNRAATRIH